MTSQTGTLALRKAATASREYFSIQPVIAADFPDLASMIAAFAAYDGGAATATPEALQRDLLSPDANAWLATIIGRRASDGIPLGYAIMFRTYNINHANKEAFLAHLFVVPATRGCGLGAALLHSVRKRAFEWGCSSVQLKVDSENWRARRFYKSQGLTEKPHGRLGRTIVRLARILGYKHHLEVELVATPLADELSSGSGT